MNAVPSTVELAVNWFAFFKPTMTDPKNWNVPIDWEIDAFACCTMFLFWAMPPPATSGEIEIDYEVTVTPGLWSKLKWLLATSTGFVDPACWLKNVGLFALCIL